MAEEYRSGMPEELPETDKDIPMKSRLPILIITFLTAFLLFPAGAAAQEIDYDSLLIRRVEVENPTYMPVIAVNYGAMHFFGDVRNSFPTPLSEKSGFRLNVSSPPFDRQQTFVVNFSLLFAEVTGNERSYVDLERNINFHSTINAFGVGIEYNFGHLFQKEAPVLKPFLSLGFEPFLFSAKGDLWRGNEKYHYWSDGTIRNVPEAGGNNPRGEIMMRDWDFETDLREANLYGLGNYRQFSFAVPIELGLDFNISERMKMRMGTSLHLTFTDLIDNVSPEGEGITANESNDHFMFTYVGLHLDLFSEPKVRTEELLFAELDDFDYLMFEDEDGDGVVDGVDECPGTPEGVDVDSTGCPWDFDQDGIPDYQDDEDSAPGAIVNDRGVEMTEDDLERLLATPDAISRSDLDLYLVPTQQRERMTFDQLDEKFHVLDLDGDQYFSFDELLLAIDDFFDFRSFMDTDEVYEIINFFFAQ
jgi:hypothetical protein